jgi:hypothetical protein
MVLILPTGQLFLTSDSKLARSPIVQQEECRSLISAVTIVKNLANMRQAQQVAVGLCQKIMTLQ